MDRNTTEERPR